MTNEMHERFINQLGLYIDDLKNIYEQMLLNCINAEQKKEILSLIHQVSGLCLTFNLNEEGSIARFVEKRLRDLLSQNNRESLQQGALLLKNLISACEEVCEASQCDASQKETKDKAVEDDIMHKKYKAKVPHFSSNTQEAENYHILIVDDDPVIRMLAERKLKVRGYKVTTAKDGVLGVKLAKAILPNLILMDGSMPHMDGMEAAQILKNDPETELIPIFLLTAYYKNEISAGYRNDIIDEYIEKPFNVDTIIHLINQYSSPSSET